MLSKLSLVMLTYNRQRYALRNMQMWSGYDAQMYVLDGTEDPIDAKSLLELGSNIIYRHLPVSIVDRLAEAACFIKTDYVLLLADDEFFIPTALEACVDALEKDSQAVACCGQGLGKFLQADLITYESAIKSVERVSRVDRSHSIERMVEHMNPYSMNTIYAVCRSLLWKKAILSASSCNYSTVMAIEIYFELLMSYQGKLKVIDRLMWLRSDENPSQADVDGALSFFSWFTDPKFSLEVADFFNDLTTRMANTGERFTSIELKDGLTRACDAYLTYCETAKRADKTSQIAENRQNSHHLFKLFTGWLKRQSAGSGRRAISFLPAALVKLFPVQYRFRPYIDAVRAIESNGVEVDWDHVKKILNAVSAFHKPSAKIAQ
jgi:glycosyltransferase domain-containing protein